MSDRDLKIKEAIKEAAAQFLSRESNRKSLITVTDVVLSPDGKEADILFTVLPTTQEAAAVDFANRKRAEFKQFLFAKFKLGRVPFMTFGIDKGEKHRQRIDEITAKF
jgi:ribosome-binding factor A